MSTSADRTNPDAIRADIEQTRADLGDNVAELTRRADVKTRAKQYQLLRAGPCRLTHPVVHHPRARDQRGTHARPAAVDEPGEAAADRRQRR